MKFSSIGPLIDSIYYMHSKLLLDKMYNDFQTKSSTLSKDVSAKKITSSISFDEIITS